MPYDNQQAKHMSTHLSEWSEQLEILNLQCAELRSNYEKTKSYLYCQSKFDPCAKIENCQREISQLKCKNASLEEECVNFQVDLLETTDLANSDPDDLVTEPTSQSIIGSSQKYTPEIRKLYYNIHTHS